MVWMVFRFWVTFSPRIAVAPGGTRGQAAVVIDQFHGAAVHLGLQDIIKLIRGLEKPLQAVVELPGPGLAEGVFQGQHGLPVPDGFKLIQGLGPDPLGGGIGRGQAVVFLQPGEFGHEAVELGIRDHRIIQHIVPVIVVIELFPELMHPGDHLRGNVLVCHGRCPDWRVMGWESQPSLWSGRGAGGRGPPHQSAALTGIGPTENLPLPRKRSWGPDPLITMIGGFGRIGKAQRPPGRRPGLSRGEYVKAGA